MPGGCHSTGYAIGGGFSYIKRLVITGGISFVAKGALRFVQATKAAIRAAIPGASCCIRLSIERLGISPVTWGYEISGGGSLGPRPGLPGMGLFVNGTSTRSSCPLARLWLRRDPPGRTCSAADLAAVQPLVIWVHDGWAKRINISAKSSNALRQAHQGDHSGAVTRKSRSNRQGCFLGRLGHTAPQEIHAAGWLSVGSGALRAPPARLLFQVLLKYLCSAALLTVLSGLQIDRPVSRYCSFPLVHDPVRVGAALLPGRFSLRLDRWFAAARAEPTLYPRLRCESVP